MSTESFLKHNFYKMEVEITNRCNVKCPRCPRTVFKEQFKRSMNTHDLSLEDFVKFIEPTVDELQILKFKGTDGDPIFHPKFLDWIEWAKSENLKVVIHTNGNIGSKSFWEKLAVMLDKKDRVILGIDGTPENFTEYRVGSIWKNVLTAITELASNCHLEWQYIVFKYNQDNIDETRELSQQLTYNSFTVLATI